MKRILIVLILIASFANLCLGGEMRADAAYGVKYIAEQIVELPQDHDKPYLTITGSQHDPRYRTLVRWFDVHPTLQGIADQTHFNTIPTQSPHWFERLAPTYREVPCVRLQDATGNIIAEFAGNDIPMSADALARGLNTQARRCLRRTPDVEPTPQPLMPSPQRSHFPWILLGILSASGAGLGLTKGYFDLYHKK